ncbi:MAG: UDP-N-acetylmuramate dehydrogenase [Pseudomonadota bacterium]
MTLLDRLPPVRGRYTPKAPLAGTTWFRCGGSAEVLFRPTDLQDLQQFLRDCPSEIPKTVIGVGSNLLIRDGGIPGVTIRLGKSLRSIKVNREEHEISAEGAALDLNVALTARDAGVGGLEFLSGIPGTIGAALRMNAGAYGVEMKDVVVSAEALDGEGRRHAVSVHAMNMGYRRTSVPEDWIFVSARLRGHAAPVEQIADRISEIRTQREESQPTRGRTGGSTFANPDQQASEGRKAWELIDQAGCRGLTIGGAVMSEKHCNFMLNTGNATAADLETLGETVRARVFESTGILLRWEIRCLGVPADAPDAVATDGETNSPEDSQFDDQNEDAETHS